MKWLFAILVALNIIVFAGTITYRVSERGPNSALSSSEHNSSKMHELNTHNTIPQTQSGNSAEWAQSNASQVLSEDAALAAMHELDKTDEQKAAEKEAKEKAIRLAKEKKNKERLAKKAKEELARLANEDGLPPPESASAQMGNPRSKPAPALAKTNKCSLTGRVTIPEDDYHRLKGLLNHWPNSVNRTVTRRSNTPAAATTSIQYQVWVASNGDSAAQQAELTQKGFQGALVGSRISIGSFKSKSAAQALLAKINQSGISGASIAENVEQSAAVDNSLSVAHMDVFFTSLSEQEFNEVQKVVGKYGRLQRGACR